MHHNHEETETPEPAARTPWMFSHVASGEGNLSQEMQDSLEKIGLN